MATLIGAGAILLWASLALLTAASGKIPAFELAALTFAIGGALGLAVALARGRAHMLRQPAHVWLVGLGGLFGYHAAYFLALRLAPPAEAGLVNYLWPLLIVVLSSLLPGEHLRARHVLGALLGLAGLIAMAVGTTGLAGDTAAWPGYACALFAAFVWALYSVLSRRLSQVPTDATAGFCLGTAALALICHLGFETTVWPQGVIQWGAILALGVGPVGLAFYLWDHGVKRGDIRMLGILSYATPILSTTLLIVAGYATPSVGLGIACLCIVAGALVASWTGRSQAAGRT